MDPSLLGRPIQAPTARKVSQGLSGRTLFLIVAGVIAIAIGGFLLLSSGENTGPLQQRLSARQATTLKIVADGQKNISNDDLSKLNSEVSIILNGDNIKLQAALKTAGFKKIDKSITAAEADLDTFTKLKTAKLNAQYDTTYSNILTQKLESLRALTKEIYDKTNSKSLKAALNDEYTHLGGFVNKLSEL